MFRRLIVFFTSPLSPWEFDGVDGPFLEVPGLVLAFRGSGAGEPLQTLGFRQKEAADDDAFGFAEFDEDDFEGSGFEDALLVAIVEGILKFHQRGGGSGWCLAVTARRHDGKRFFFGFAEFENEFAAAVTAHIALVGAFVAGGVGFFPNGEVFSRHGLGGDQDFVGDGLSLGDGKEGCGDDEEAECCDHGS